MRHLNYGNKSRRKGIDFVVSENGCFEVTSHNVGGAYPRIMAGGKRWTMSNFVYTECFGDIPDGLIVRHKCDNYRCVNPEHLELGTRDQNMKDMISRGRSLKGEKNVNSKLTEKQAREIKFSDLSRKELMKKFNVSYSCVKEIQNNKRWKHIEENSHEATT